MRRKALPHNKAEQPFGLPKPTEWVGSAKADLKEMAATVQDEIGQSLQAVQWGGTPDNCKPLRGNLRGVWEVRVNFETATYRAYYAVVFPKAIYVLHCHKKKSKRGGSIPQEDELLIMKRFKRAYLDYQEHYGVD